jgi:hypothetical protein
MASAHLDIAVFGEVVLIRAAIFCIHFHYFHAGAHASTDPDWRLLRPFLRQMGVELQVLLFILFFIKLIN